MLSHALITRLYVPQKCYGLNSYNILLIVDHFVEPIISGILAFVDFWILTVFTAFNHFKQILSCVLQLIWTGRTKMWQVGEWIDTWTDRGMDRWVDGGMNEWLDKQACIYMLIHDNILGINCTAFHPSRSGNKCCARAFPHSFRTGLPTLPVCSSRPKNLAPKPCWKYLIASNHWLQDSAELHQFHQSWPLTPGCPTPRRGPFPISAFQGLTLHGNLGEEDPPFPFLEDIWG